MIFSFLFFCKYFWWKFFFCEIFFLFFWFFFKVFFCDILFWYKKKKFLWIRKKIVKEVSCKKKKCLRETIFLVKRFFLTKSFGEHFVGERFFVWKKVFVKIFCEKLFWFIKFVGEKSCLVTTVATVTTVTTVTAIT